MTLTDNNPSLNVNIIPNYFAKVIVTEPSTSSQEERRMLRDDKRWVATYGHKTGLFFAVWNLINDILGPGTVGMGQYVAQSGLVLSSILILFFAAITFYTLAMVFNLSKRHKRNNMPALAQDAFGKPGYILCCVMIFLFNFGGFCAQFIMAGEIIPQLLYQMFGVNNFLTSRTAVIIYVTVVLSPFAFMRTLSSFALLSFLSVAGVISIGVIVFYKAAIGDCFNPPLPSDWRVVHPEVMSALGGLSYLYVCHDLSFNVFDELKHSTKKRYYTVVFIAMAVTAATTGTIGVCGYLLFFDLNLKEANVLKLLPENDIIVTIGRVIFAMNIALSIPYSVFMPRYALTYITASIFPSLSTNKKRSFVLHIVLTVLVILSGLTIGLTCTDLGVVFELTGGVSACSIAYIIPPLLLLKLEKGWFTKEKLGAFIILVIGLAIFSLTLSSVIYGLVKGN